jgi:hypothetical protein
VEIADVSWLWLQTIDSSSWLLSEGNLRLSHWLNSAL